MDLGWIEFPVRSETRDAYYAIIDAKGREIMYLPFQGDEKLRDRKIRAIQVGDLAEFSKAGINDYIRKEEK